MTERNVRPADQDVYDLPFDPETRDIVCRRDRWQHVDSQLGPSTKQALHFNIERRHVQGSPSGWEWGYLGSGPHDLALNILAYFIGPAPECGAEPEDSDADNMIFMSWKEWAECEGQSVRCWDGTYVHRTAWDLHWDFCREFIATLPPEGGTIPGATIERWIADRTGVPA